MKATPSEAAAAAPQGWRTPGVRGIGVASLLSDLGHEVPTALLPSLLSVTLGAPASALGIIEGVADGVAGVARLGGGALADDPSRRRTIAVGGYTSTAVLSSLIGVAGTAWQVALLRAGAWAARGARGPARNALLADIAPPSAYGRAYGFERAMDNFGAILGPLAALALVVAVGTRAAIVISLIPGLLAAVAMIYAIRHAPRAEPRERSPMRLRVRQVARGRLGRLILAVSAFEVANVAATLFILRATQLLAPTIGLEHATQLALVLYAGYNAAAAGASVPAGRLGDRRGGVRVLGAGIVLFGLANASFALAGAVVALLIPAFLLAGVGIGFAETAETTVVAVLAPPDIRGSAFGVLAGVQAFGNLAASAMAGILWTAVSAAAAFAYLALWCGVALLGLILAAKTSKP